MTKTEAFLLKLAKKSNIWSVNETEKNELISILSEEAFIVPKELESIILRKASGICSLFNKKMVKKEDLVFSFLNLILGTIFSDFDYLYLKVENEIYENIPSLKEHNKNSYVDKKIVSKIYSYVKGKTKFLEDDLNSKKVS